MQSVYMLEQELLNREALEALEDSDTLDTGESESSVNQENLA